MGTQDIILEKIKNDFQILVKVVLNQFTLCKKETIDLDEINTNEGIIDSLEVKIRSEVISSIVLYNPRAIDLRKIIAYYDMTAYLERIGDHLLNIAEEKSAINTEGIIYKKCCEEIENFFTIVEMMTQNAIFAFACEDNALAKKTIVDDDKADEVNFNIMKALTLIGADRTLSESEVKDLLQLGALSSNLERVGDNATNIAEAAIYITEGRDIKHNNQ